MSEIKLSTQNRPLLLMFRFVLLASYLASLQSLHFNDKDEPIKGKAIARQCFQHAKPTEIPKI